MRLLAALLLAACTLERTTMLATVVSPPPLPPAEILATGVSLLWHDATYVGWSIFVVWREEGGAGSPCHTDYVPCRAPWGGPWSIDDCVTVATADIVDGYRRRWGLPRAPRVPPPWTGPRAWWWQGDQAVEPLLRLPALGAPEQ